MVKVKPGPGPAGLVVGPRAAPVNQHDAVVAQDTFREQAAQLPVNAVPVNPEIDG